MRRLMRVPSAWLPILMTLCALALVVGWVAIHGIDQEPPADEGPAARIFQLLLAGQLPIMAFFAIKWLPQVPRQALQILVLQVGAALSAFALVFFLEM
jgi:hypothetical protein